MSKWRLPLAALIAVLVSAGVAAESHAQSAPNLSPPPFLTPSTTGAQIGAFDPTTPDNPNYLKPAGTVMPASDANFAPAAAASETLVSGGGACNAYDSWCAYCATHSSSDVCEAAGSGD